MDKNVGKMERWASVVGGGALAAWALRRERRLSPLSGGLAVGAAALLLRGATGYCPAYGALGMSTADLGDDWSRPLSRPHGKETFRGQWKLPEGARPVGAAGGGTAQRVEEDSAASFPAS